MDFYDLEESFRDPHPLLDSARARGDLWFDPSSDAWLITGYQATRAALQDLRLISRLAPEKEGRARSGTEGFVRKAIQRQMIFSDGPRQQHLHDIIVRESARRAKLDAEWMGQLAAAKLAGARDAGRFDLVRDFAQPFSLEVIARMLGIPARDAPELGDLGTWSGTFGDLTSGCLGGDIEDVVRLAEYFRGLVAEKKGTASDDLIGALIQAGEFADDEDLVVQCMMILAAGRITTQRLLGNGVPLLIPEWARWRNAVIENPGFSKRLAEEVLRVVTPTRYVVRTAAERMTLRGATGEETIQRGQRVVLFLLGANHDPATFGCPHTVDASRAANPHLTFGHGPHRCPGAATARVEVAAALQALLTTFSRLVPSPDAVPAWSENPNLAGYASYVCLCE